MNEQLYRINPTLVEPKFTESGIARLISNGDLVPMELDYAAAAEERDRQLRANVLDVTAIVDAALKGNTLPASMLNMDGVTWGLDDEDEYIEVAVVPHVEADDE